MLVCCREECVSSVAASKYVYYEDVTLHGEIHSVHRSQLLVPFDKYRFNVASVTLCRLG